MKKNINKTPFSKRWKMVLLINSEMNILSVAVGAGQLALRQAGAGASGLVETQK